MIPLVDSHYLINHSSDAAFIIDGGLEIVAWNQAARLEIIDPNIKDYSGHIVKHTGDGFLAEFGSVNDAVNCAIAMQKLLAERAENTPKDRRMLFRMGQSWRHRRGTE